MRHLQIAEEKATNEQVGIEAAKAIAKLESQPSGLAWWHVAAAGAAANTRIRGIRDGYFPSTSTAYISRAGPRGSSLR